MTLKDEIHQVRPFAGPEQEAYLAILRTAAVLEHSTSELLREHGITPTQYNVLRILRGAGEAGLCRNDVRDRMVARVPDASRLLDRLEAAGLIERRRDAADRRFVTTRITAAGREILAALDGPILELHGRQFAGVGGEELSSVIEVLGRVRSASGGE